MESGPSQQGRRTGVPDLLAAILIGLLILVVSSVALQKGNAYDEIIDIAAGYSYLRTGDYRLCPEHPALATALTAAPLLLVGMEDPRTDPDYRAGTAWRADTRWQFAFRTVHESRTDARVILLLARLPSVLLCALLGFALYRFARAEYGPWAGVASLFLLSTSPTFVAHSALATGDSILTALGFVAFAALHRSLREVTWGRIGIAGAALGAALAVKMTAFILFPVAIVLALTSRTARVGRPFEGWISPLPAGARRIARRGIVLLLVFLVALLSLHVVYLWRSGGGEEGPSYLHAPETMGTGGGLGSALLSGIGWLLPEEYAHGLREMAHSSERGWPAFLFGVRYDRAPLWAYPAVFIVKTREVLLLGLLVGLLAWGRLGLGWSRLVGIIALPALLLIVLGTGAGYHGARILLPALPFVCLAVGAAAARGLTGVRFGRTVAAAGCLAALLPGSIAYPHLLAYQNLLAGGRGSDYRRLVDSDLDWGQDLPALERRLERMGSPTVHLKYFGTDDPRRYGFDFRLLEGCDPVSGTIAISATHLQGVYLDDGDCYGWLRRLEPAGRAGRSILIYQVP